MNFLRNLFGKKPSKPQSMQQATAGTESRIVIGECETCHRPLRVKAHAVKSTMRLTCKCGHANIVHVPETLVPRHEEHASDVEVVYQYCQHLAQQWWQTTTLEQAVCDRCNIPILPRNRSYLIGTNLYCFGCWVNHVGSDVMGKLRANPDCFGRGLLDKAREFVANKQP